MDKDTRFAAIVGVVVACVVAAVIWVATHPSGPAWDFSDARVAASVNDATITEGQVSQQVFSFRQACGLSEDEAWYGWLAGQRWTPQMFRSQRIDQLVRAQALEQLAAREGVSVTDEDVQAEVARLRDSFIANGGETEESWQSGLALNGYTDETFAQEVRSDLIEAALPVGALDDFYAQSTIDIAPMPNDLPYAQQA